MNNWLKIGLPVLVAALLLVSAVGVTLAVTGGNTAGQANLTAYQADNSALGQYAMGPWGYGNNGYGRTNGYGPGYGGCPGWGDRD
jgi:hypothetical protein